MNILKMKNSFRHISLITLICIIPYIGVSQIKMIENSNRVKLNSKKVEIIERAEGFDLSKLYLGGNLGLLFGSYTYIEVSPSIGYWFTERFTGGANLSYRYFEDRNEPRWSTNTYGGGIFGRFFPVDYAFAHVEFESLNGDWVPGFRPRYWINSIFIGGGYAQRFGNGFSAIMLLYNINNSVFNPYRNPIIRVTVGIPLSNK